MKLKYLITIFLLIFLLLDGLIIASEDKTINLDVSNAVAVKKTASNVEETKLNLSAEEITKLIEHIEDPDKRDVFLTNLKTLKKTLINEDINQKNNDELSINNFLKPIDNYSKAFIEDLSQFGHELKSINKVWPAVKNFFSSEEKTSLFFKFLTKAFVIFIVLMSLIYFNSKIKLKRIKKLNQKNSKSKILKGFFHLGIDAMPFFLFLFLIAPIVTETITIGSELDLMVVMLALKKNLLVFLYILVFSYFLISICGDLLAPQNEEDRILPVSNGTAVLVYKFLKQLTIVWAITIYINHAILSIWSNSIFYDVMGRLLYLPIAIVITYYFFKIKNQWSNINAGTVRENYFLHHVVLYFKKYWFLPTLLYVWLVVGLQILGLGDKSAFFVKGVLGTLGSVLLVLFIGYCSAYLLNKFLPKQINSHNTLIKTGQLAAYALCFPLIVLLILLSWNLPLAELYEHPVAYSIISRGLSIFALLILALVLIKTSNILIDWILSVKKKDKLWVTLTPISHSIFKTLVIFIIIVSVLDRIGINVGPILAGAGILGLGVGMGAQSLVKDVITGLSILIADMVSIGDVVNIVDITGTVESIGLRSMRIRDSSGNVSIIPNSSIVSITNMTKTFSQELVHFEVAYNSDMDLVYKVILETAKTIEEDPKYAKFFEKPIKIIGIQEFGPSAVIIRTRITSKPGQQWAIAREFRKRILPAFSKNNIEIPLQQLVVHQVASSK